MVIEEGKISMDPGKLRGIQDWPAPTTVKQTRGFLGFGNFYRRFIRHFSNLAKPLNNLLKKDQKFEWTEECQRVFDDLKKRFTEEPVLMMPDQTRPFQIETDASKYATGAVLTQLDSNGDRHQVSFISKTFSPAERNYEHYLSSTATLCHSTYLSQLITNCEHQFERLQLTIQKHALSSINVWKLNLMEPPTRSFGQQKTRHYHFHPYEHTLLLLPLEPHLLITTSAHLFITS
jgi:RNase H-like domain found in reverse transcriptase